MSPVTTPPAERDTVLTAYEVTELQSQRAYPSISILATTRPGPTLHGEDVSALRGLAADAARRLAAEHTDHLDADPEQLLAAVHELIGEAAGRPTDRAVALFVSATQRRRVNLPVPVVNRCVIDPTFATRDLVRALQHTPHHAVLLLSADEARLLHDRGGILTRVTSGGFPVRRRTLGARRSSADERPTDFLRRVDRALGVALRLDPMPLVLAAPEPTASRFQRLSRNTGRLAGVVRGSHLHTGAEELTTLTRPVLQDYLRSRAQEALDLVEQRAGTGRVLTDITSAWRAARWERPELLAVEEDYFYPARLGQDGDSLIPTDEVDHPDVIDDAVDELIEIVLGRGGWIALLAAGQLPGDARLALTLRR
ncbi:hypothetical protein MJO55_27150 [Mycolicibacterium rufum]|uniref:Uncharacterized protein n=1 Tax=Mycolicibacterium rufum TaxID=318424 RepID=A0A9X2XZS9_9MYCO|nr:hypothetical protein [Mycolicibacterium rufum]KGI70464.1 hypothetical protein EU78_27025 [Mycolicibacterium rufum]MCV7071671.1 hypothetical protein [Mycolicibacterium rufum]ULP36793.1 hypothetical protein MJO55_27150 [Mycolicibacterium rufum]